MNYKTNNHEDYTNEENIDLRKIISSISRNRLIFASGAALSVAVSGLYLLIKKPVWEGSFQIVIENEKKTGRSAREFLGSPLLSSASGFLGAQEGLATEVSILKSPSILQPVFNFVKSEKQKAGENIRMMTYRGWTRSSLKIGLQKGTTVLNISYKDKDKNLIIPVLERISTKYQNYSGRDQKKSINKAIAFLEDQLISVKEKSRSSLSALQTFSLDNGLGHQDGLPSDNINLNSSFSRKNKETTNRYAIHFSRLSQLEAELIEKSAIFKSNSESIKLLQQRIDALKSSLTRPKEILLEYRLLKSAAIRDEQMLEKIQKQLSTYRLEKAQKEDPWELIFRPTLLDVPVSPKKPSVLFLGILGGLVLGTSLAIYKDIKSKRLYTVEDLKPLIPFPLLIKLPANSPKVWRDSIECITTGLLKNNTDQRTALITLGGIDEKNIEILSNIFKDMLQKRELIISSNINETSQCVNKLLILSTNFINTDQLELIVSNLSLQKGNVLGWIFIDNELEL
tara:strand:+ start:2675 stop:4207 length:1533 start_codon:yes stop_codon:yes gene_type:complete